MITLNSLSAFAQEISRRPIPEQVRGVTPAAPPPPNAAQRQQVRALEELPPEPPVQPMPRGSLLDLRV